MGDSDDTDGDDDASVGKAGDSSLANVVKLIILSCFLCGASSEVCRRVAMPIEIGLCWGFPGQNG